jgi:DNA polymerase III subunit beta
MKVELDRKDLLQAVQRASRAVSNRATLPVLSGVRITANGKLEVAGTDLETTIATEVACTTGADGSVIVPSKLFAEVLKASQGETVALVGTEGEVEVHAGRSRHRVRAMSVEEYPALPVEVERPTAWTEVSALELETALIQVTRAASSDESRYILTGVAFEVEGETLTLAATDSYRLAVKEVPLRGLCGSHRVVVPARACREVIRLAKKRARVEIGFREDLVLFRIGADLIGSRYIEGEFVKWRQLIPEGAANVATVEREELAAVVKRVGLMAQNNLPMKLTLGGGAGGLAPAGWKGSVEVSAHTPDIGEATEVIEAATEGDPLVIAFNPQFLLDGIGAIEGDTVRIEAADGLKPALIRSGSDAFTYLLMPVRLS